MYDLNKITLDFVHSSAQRIENVDDADYFGPMYKDYISNSQLKLINPEEGGAPTKFLEGFGSVKSPALELGTAVHQMILEKDKYFLSEVEKPSGKVGLIIDSLHRLMTTEGLEIDKALHSACIEQDYYKSSLTQKRMDDVLEKGRDYLDFLQGKESQPGVIVLSQTHREKLDGCLKSTKNNKIIMNLLNPPKEQYDDITQEMEPVDVVAYNEDVLVMDFVATIPPNDDDVFGEGTQTVVFSCKAKIDNWTIDYTNKVLTLNDLKTTGKPINTFGGNEFESVSGTGNKFKTFQKGSFQTYHYYRQMAMYGFLLKAYATEHLGFDDSWTLKVNMLVVETNVPYMSHAFAVGTKWLTIGYHEFIDLLKRVSFHKLHGFDKFLEMDFDSITEI